ncbi:ABC transporter substrate-binding protein [Roseomonas sp. SSH11]|uniref:ABC transporter substrate-binding protein n=1 Tax=Pararoseomonas baculiformis TaxID=2820812 RepID=A0ABS4ACE1_9PROT|nr:ABC transporter substrate-binding protein [Pararoseomonas baculiformis]MBP0444681.1 ABC transporter substrate-binding protein [Pararoseomonas baculiformis]
MHRRSLLAASSLLAAPAFVPGLARAQGASRAGTLRVVPETLTTILDPHFTTSFTTRDFSYLVYDTLLAVNDKWEPTPQMAERWEVSPDGMEYRFTLREGLTFHDGTAVTGEDCVASLRRWGARDALGGTMLRATETLDAPDPRTLRIKLKQPFGLVLQALSKPGAMVPMIMPKRLAETPPNRPVTEPIGSGPYRFVAAEYRPGDRIVLVRHEGYRPRTEPSAWASGAKRPTFDRIELIAMPDVSSQVSALSTGEVDYLERLPADVLPILRRNRDVKVQVVSPFGYQGLMRFNHLQPPFNDVRVRRAVMMAVDQADYLPGVAGLPEYGRECRSMLGCGTPYETTAGMPLKPDMEAARRLLRESGTDLSRPVVILHPADAPGIASLGLVTQDLLTRLGFTVDLQSMDLNTFFGRRTRPEGWNLFHTTNTVPDMQTPLQNPYMDGAGAPAGFAGWPQDEGVQQARAAFAGATSEEERKRAAEEAHRHAAEAGFYMPLGQFVAASAWRAELTEVPMGPAMFLWNIRRGR